MAKETNNSARSHRRDYLENKKTMTLFLPSSERDLRLDLFRGLANWAIFLGHIPNTVLAWFTPRHYGFSDGADLFVFVSGYTATLVFGRMMVQRGFLIGATRLLRRVWQLYVAHALLFLFYLTSVHFLSHNFNIPHLMDQFNVARLMEFPVETLTQGLILKFKPLNLDVLPLYIVLMAMFPPVLWLILLHKNWALVGSLSLYFTARHFHWNLPSYPEGGWYFNPFTWQLLFVLGAWLAAGGARTIRPLLDARFILVPGVFFLLFAFAATLSTQVPALQTPFSIAIFGPFTPNDKTNLAPYRVIHLLALALLIVKLIHFDWPGLRWPVLHPVIKCGQQSLEVFCVGVFLSFIAHFILDATSDALPVQILVGAGGLCIMTGVAYYRSWSKRIDRLAITNSTKQISAFEGAAPPAIDGTKQTVDASRV